MSNALDTIQPREIKPGSNRSFGFVFAGFFTIVALVRWWRDGSPWIWLAVAVAFALVATAAPGVLRPLNQIWFRFGMLLHRIVSPLLMGAMFFLAVTPTALLLRVLGKDILRLKWDPTAPTYWIARTPPGPDPKTMKNQF